MDGSERAVENLKKQQADLKAGKLAQEAYDKSLAETKLKVEEGAAKFPESAPVQTSAARAFIQAGDSEKALEDYRRAAELDPSFTADYTSALARLAARAPAQAAPAAEAKPSATSGRSGSVAELTRDAWNLQPKAVGLGAFVLLVLAAGGYALLRR
jgi:tetratricopeptide (TPR) repeat protein